MANEQNLIKNSERTPSERRESAKKAGVASGKARRKKANLKKAFETILQAEVASPNVKKQLEELGFDSTNEMALAMVMMQKAMKGNVRAFEQISKLIRRNKKNVSSVLNWIIRNESKSFQDLSPILGLWSLYLKP